MTAENIPTSRPVSESHIWANLLGCAVFFSLVYYFQQDSLFLTTRQLAITFAAAMLPLMATDALRRLKAGEYKAQQSFYLPRLVLKLIGLYATLGLLMLCYWLFPEYGKPFYRNFLAILYTTLPWLAGLAIPYFAWIDRRMKAPEDGYYHFGLLIAGQWRRADRRMVAEHLRSWAVKAFFLPLMSLYLIDNIRQLAGFYHDFSDFSAFYRAAYHFTYSLDLLYACAGYVMTLRLFNTQIFSAEPTTIGWVACLACYQPFWAGLLYGSYFNYDDAYYWDQLTAGSPIMHIVWGSAILLCSALYAWATIAFGYRFSNLTYRGLIANGPYRITKHPAYVFKCASWWLVSVPFIASQGLVTALQQCLLLTGLCLIYFLRARTEERHLSHYPEYIAYAEWMNQHSIFRWIPFLRYSRERALAKGGQLYAPYTGREMAGS